MNKKMGAGVSVVIAIITVVGVGSYSFDFSQTNIGQIGDNIINNYIQNELGIDIEKFKENCDAGMYIGKEAQGYCELIT
jgi:hypothetical protein